MEQVRLDRAVVGARDGVRAAVALVALLVLLVTAGVAAPPAAAAEPRCVKTVRLDMPGKIALKRQLTLLPVRLVDPCGTIEYASWFIHPLRPDMGWDVSFDRPATTDDFEVWDHFELGRHTTIGLHARDVYGGQLPMAESTYTLKLGTDATVTTERRGGRVHFDVRARYWSPKYHKMRAWDTGAKLQRREDGRWVTIKKFDLDGQGRATLSVARSTTEQYRVHVPEDRNAWAATSSAVRR